MKIYLIIYLKISIIYYMTIIYNMNFIEIVQQDEETYNGLFSLDAEEYPLP
jgi:hypothetical protein